eukprot:6253818-Lingulodinium_polyedra.AAC.1
MLTERTEQDVQAHVWTWRLSEQQGCASSCQLDACVWACRLRDQQECANACQLDAQARAG